MVDPSNITIYNATDEKLEELILFWISAAGKNGQTAAKCLDKLLTVIDGKEYPFKSIRKTDSLPKIMKQCGMGCYTSKSRSFIEVAGSDLNLRTCEPDDLEKIYGIGRKTSRCFIIHSRPNARYAGLDTHILKYLRLVGIEDVPKATPSSKKQYLRLEKEFLKLADLNEMSPSDFDLAIWNTYAVKST